jgi:TPR repeat protein
MNRPLRKAALACVIVLAGAGLVRGQDAIEDLTRRAQAGDVQAQFRLAVAYDGGRGVLRDFEEARKWYRRAAEGGLAEAQNSLGSMLQEDGKFAEAIAWYEKAAAQGHARATNSLGLLHDLGQGVPQDRRKGFELYTRAAELGWAEAMLNIGVMHGAGQLGQPDLVAACTWFVRAGRFADASQRQVHVNLRRAMPQLERMLSAEQLATCRKEGESWSPNSR